MQLFLFLNGLAGRSPFLDQVVRYFYIGAVPILATLFLGQLILMKPRDDAPSLKSVLLALLISICLVELTDWALGFVSQSWGLGNISTRPYMTRWINLLILEPQDNSFPCLEVMVAAIVTTGMAILNRKWGVAGAIITVLLCLARMFCGTNYLADVLVGAGLGVGFMGLLLAAFAAPASLFFGQRAKHLIVSGGVLLTTLLGTYICLLATPRLASKVPSLFGSSPSETTSPEQPQRATKAARGALQEGEAEGGSSSEEAAGNDAEAIALTKRSHLFLPNVEKFLRGRLSPVARPFRLLDVEVAPVRAGNTTYRCAALRFEIPYIKSPDLRRQTAEVAARLVKASFANDLQIQNVDVVAIVRGDGSTIDGSSLKFVGDEVPVFTASIQRTNLVLKKPLWANAPTLDGGSWLRTRSLLYVNEKVLPAPLQRKSGPVPTPIASAVPPAAKTVTPSAAIPSSPKAATPIPTATATARLVVPTKMTTAKATVKTTTVKTTTNKATSVKATPAKTAPTNRPVPIRPATPLIKATPKPALTIKATPPLAATPVPARPTPAS